MMNFEIVRKHPDKAVAILVFILMILWSFLSKQTETEAPTVKPESPETADTVIPAGFVLVPIDLANKDSLGALIGDFALVDLFTVGLDQKKGKRIGKDLKLLRAPLNPEMYAVLVPENDTARFFDLPGPYWAVIQNPKRKSQTQISQEAKFAKPRIEVLKTGG